MQTTLIALALLRSRAMLESIEFANFRGASGELRDFAQLNVLLGPNNGGKSTCLEAIALAAERVGTPTRMLEHLAARRGLGGFATAAALAGADGRFSISGRVYGEERRTSLIGRVHEHFGSVVELSLREYDGGGLIWQGASANLRTATCSPSLLTDHALFIDARSMNEPEVLEQAVSESERKGARTSLLALARKFVPGVTDLRLHLADGHTVLFVEEGTHYWPALVGGDGFKRMLFLAAKVAAAGSITVCVEEPDAFLHKSAIDGLAAVLLGAGDVHADAPQIFVTTHSIDLVRSLLRQAEDDGVFAIYRVERAKDRISATRFSQDLAEYEQPRLERALGYS